MRIFNFLLPGFFFISLSSISVADPTTVLRTAETHPETYPTAKALIYMGKLLQSWSHGALVMKLYAGGQLGEEKDSLEITIFGGIDINRVNLAPLNSIVPETIVLGLPFLFRSTEHMRKVVDSSIGDEILKSLEPHELIGLAFYDSGARSFYNTSRPIHSPEDLAGLKVRVQNSELAVEMVKALGANPTPMGFGQVYESLVLGTIDASENNWPSYESTRHFEVAPFYSLTQHTMMPEILVVSKHRWDKLSKEQRILLKRAARASVPYMREHWDKRVRISKEKVIAAGTVISSNPDLQKFSDAMKPIYEKFLVTEKMKNLAIRIQEMDSR